MGLNRGCDALGALMGMTARKARREISDLPDDSLKRLSWGFGDLRESVESRGDDAAKIRCIRLHNAINMELLARAERGKRG